MNIKYSCNPELLLNNQLLLIIAIFIGNNNHIGLPEVTGTFITTLDVWLTIKCILQLNMLTWHCINSFHNVHLFLPKAVFQLIITRDLIWVTKTLISHSVMPTSMEMLPISALVIYCTKFPKVMLIVKLSEELLF